MISFEVLGQLKAVPPHSVLPPPTMLHLYISVSSGQAQLAFAGTSRVLFTESKSHHHYDHSVLFTRTKICQLYYQTLWLKCPTASPEQANLIIWRWPAKCEQGPGREGMHSKVATS
jgi:hypothetical protein